MEACASIEFQLRGFGPNQLPRASHFCEKHRWNSVFPVILLLKDVASSLGDDLGNEHSLRLLVVGVDESWKMLKRWYAVTEPLDRTCAECRLL